MRSLILGMLLCFGANQAGASEPVGAKLTHIIKGLVASSEELLINEETGEPLQGRAAENRRAAAQRVMLHVAIKGVHAQENRDALALIPNGGWLFYAAMMAKTYTSAEFCVVYDEACRTAIAEDQIPWYEGASEAEREAKDAQFEQAWQALGFEKVRFGP